MEDEIFGLFLRGLRDELIRQLDHCDNPQAAYARPMVGWALGRLNRNDPHQATDPDAAWDAFRRALQAVGDYITTDWH